MGPVTNALTSLALARAGQKHLPRNGMAILVVAGVAPDLDYLSYFGGPSSFLRYHRAALHSIVGAAFVVVVTAGAFWALGHRRKPREAGAAAKPPVRFCAALIPALVGVVAHIVLGLASGVGVGLLWPFRRQRCAWNLLTNLDIWIVILLLACLLIPELLQLVSEEIGERKKRFRGRFAAILGLSIVAAYVGARAVLRGRAVAVLMSSVYQGRTPLSAGAFPTSSSPLVWRGVAATDDTLEEIGVSLAPGAQFDPERSLSRYKPADSAALEAGEAARDTRFYLPFARFPLASVTQREEGYRFEVHDLQFAPGDLAPENTFVRVDLNSKLEITDQEILFASSPGP